MQNRPVSVVSVSLYCPAGIGPAGASGVGSGSVPGFDPIARGVPRKHLKTMTRAVQLGVAAVSECLAGWPAWKEVAPERRGLYVGGSPQSGDAEDLEAALAGMGQESTLAAFAEKAVPLIPPLWLVKGLSNNILGYASAQQDFRGDNGNWCDGRLGGAVAIAAAVRAIAEGRVDLAVAGGADSLLGLDDVLGIHGSEGAAFLLLVAGDVGPWRITAGAPTEDDAEESLGELGAASVPVALARGLLARQRGGGTGDGGDGVDRACDRAGGVHIVQVAS